MSDVVDCDRIKRADDARSPKVFVVNEPMRRNPVTREFERWLPMATAGNFGEVVELLPPGSPPANLAGYVALLERGLESFREGDYLVCVGDQPLLVVAAALIGARLGGAKFKVLKWERRSEAYAPLSLGGTS